jgi:Ca-activated chloride channel family protein
MIVLAASGSMWGQIEGETKIGIAREILRQVTTKLPPGLEIGFMAYGHRRKGDCDDIELPVTPGPGRGQGTRIAGTAAALRAAESLRFTEDAAAVIPVTDGLETCDMEKQLVTLAAPARLGTYELRYWDGQNPRTIATRPIEAQVSLNAPESVEIGRAVKVRWQGPGERDDAIHLFDPEATNGEGKVLRHRNLRNDDFENRTASLPAPAQPGQYLLRYWNGENMAALASQPLVVE